MLAKIVVIMLMSLSLVLSACSSPAPSLQSPTTKAPSQTSSQTKPISSEDWKVLNRWLSELYGLPPVSNTQQLKTASSVVSSIWFKQLDKSITRMKANNIPWERAAPSYLAFNYYVLHNAQLTAASTPIEFMAADKLLADSVKEMQDTADELIRMQQLGEGYRVFSTDEEARTWFRQLDKDWERLMQEAIDKAKQ